MAVWGLQQGGSSKKMGEVGVAALIAVNIHSVSSAASACKQARSHEIYNGPKCLYTDWIQGFAGLSCHLCARVLQVPHAWKRKCLIQPAMHELVSSRKHDMFRKCGVFVCLLRLSKAFALCFRVFVRFLLPSAPHCNINSETRSCCEAEGNIVRSSFGSAHVRWGYPSHAMLHSVFN